MSREDPDRFWFGHRVRRALMESTKTDRDRGLVPDTPPTPEPRAQRRAVSKHYEGARGEQYAKTVQQHRSVEGLINRDKFVRFIKPTDTVLDFGCANGALLTVLAASDRVGIEVNAATRAEAEAAGLRVYASLNAVQDESIDVAISNHALEHVLSPYDVMTDLRRVLKVSGRLVVCVPADDWRNAPEWRSGDPNNHVFAWTPLTLGNLLEEAGFRPVEVHMRHRAWPRGYVRIHRLLPRPLWEVVCFVWAVLRRRREIMALAVPANQPNSDDSTDGQKT